MAQFRLGRDGYEFEQLHSSACCMPNIDVEQPKPNADIIDRLDTIIELLRKLTDRGTK
jgi:hypothetical protein